MKGRLKVGCPCLSTITLLLTFITPLVLPSHVQAGAKDEAQRYCSQYKTSTRQHCNVEKCPCGVGQKILKKFKRSGMKRGYCVCVSKFVKKSDNRARAEQACDSYEDKYGEECLVSSRNCPRGMIPVAKYRGGPRVKYSACRDKNGPERFKKFSNEMNQIMPQALLLVNSYKAFFKRIKNKADRLTPLPMATRRALQRYFPKVNLERVRIGYSSRATSAGITDCHRIYFKHEYNAKNIRGGRITRLLLHELYHAQQCSQWGGRNRYAMKWFRNLAPGVVRGLKRNHEKFGDRIHDKMPMEQQAERAARSRCLNMSTCKRDW